jgi:hypothetical protein
MIRKDVAMGENPFVPPKNVKPMAPTAYQRYLQESLSSLDSAADEINRMTAARIRRVPEPYFAKHLLHVVRAWVTKADPAPEIGHWLNVADGLHNPINVVDANDNILFVVPPAFVDIQLNTTDHKAARKKSMLHAINLQGVYADNTNLREFWGIEESLVQDNMAKPAEHSMAHALTQLVRMYHYYKLPLVEILGEEGAAQLAPLLEAESGVAKQTTTDNGNDDDDEPGAFEY